MHSAGLAGRDRGSLKPFTRSLDRENKKTDISRVVLTGGTSDFGDRR